MAEADETRATTITTDDSEISMRSSAGVVVIAVRGELDAASGVPLRTLLTKALEPLPTRLVLDLADLTFIDSVGLSVLVAAHNRCTAAGIAFELHHVSDACRRVLEITRLTDVLTLRP
jgi:anti-sigma B factor antagonist